MTRILRVAGKGVDSDPWRALARSAEAQTGWGITHPSEQGWGSHVEGRLVFIPWAGTLHPAVCPAHSRCAAALNELRDRWRNARSPSREPIVRDNSPSYAAAAIMLPLWPALRATLKRSPLPAAARTAQTAWENNIRAVGTIPGPRCIGRCWTMMTTINRRAVISSRWILSKTRNRFRK